MFKNILVPTDGSELSQKAVTAAIELARITGAKLTALHSYPKFSGSPYGNFGPSEDVIEGAYDRHRKEQAEILFAGIRKLADAAGVASDSALVEGDEVWKQIVATAKKNNCELICMASHGRRGLTGVVLGSETIKVLTHTDIPVLVVR